MPEWPRGMAGAWPGVRTATGTIVVTVQDVAEPPGPPPAPVLTPFSSDTIRVTAGRRPIDNTGPTITGYDRRHRLKGHVPGSGCCATTPRYPVSPGDASPAGPTRCRCGPATTRGRGPWSPTGEATTLADSAPQVLSVALPSGVTATAGGSAQLFELPSACQDPEAGVAQVRSLAETVQEVRSTAVSGASPRWAYSTEAAAVAQYSCRGKRSGKYTSRPSRFARRALFLMSHAGRCAAAGKAVRRARWRSGGLSPGHGEAFEARGTLGPTGVAVRASRSRPCEKTR